MKRTILIILAFSFFLSSCQDKGKAVFDMDTSSQAPEFQLIPDSLPNYQDMIDLLSQAGIAYQKSLVEADYLMPNVNEQIALQTGILIADLSYLRYFDKVNLSMQYAADLDERFLALDLPTEQIRQAVMDIEENMFNSDTSLMILNQAYTELTTQLIEAERSALAALIITGFWIETSHLMLNDPSVNNEELRNVAWEKHCQEIQQVLPALSNLTQTNIAALYSDFQEINCNQKDIKPLIATWRNSIRSDQWE